MRPIWILLALLTAGCLEETSTTATSPSSVDPASSAIRYAPEGEAPAATEKFVFEKRYSGETRSVTERFLVQGGGSLAVEWWTEDSIGSLTVNLIDASGESHPLSFGPDGVQGSASLAAVDGEWRLEVDLGSWSGLVHVGVTPE